MKVIPYQQLNENLYYEQMDNGLSVYILPKPNFRKTYATFSTKYGSIDNHFQIEGKPEVKVPDGIAHFLEHKMFEEPEGDIFATFSTQGASANAFTSFDRTTYLFSATEQIKDNLATLINFVQNPYFTEENVEKEKGIIGQEINMYQDNPDWRVYFGLIEALYQVHPVHIDIAGTIESIAKITKDTLYQCYETFYHPSNMILFVVGGVNPEQIMELVRTNQAGKAFDPQGEILRHFDPEPNKVRNKEKVSKLSVSLPKCMIGFKETENVETGRTLLQKELETKIVLDMLFSPSSTLYQKLYDENLISDDFSHEYNCQPGYSFSAFGGDTRDPQQLVNTIKQEIDALQSSGLSASDYERYRKKRIGNYLRMLNSPEAIANEFTKYCFKDSDLFEILPVYESMTFQQIEARFRDHFNWDQMAVSIVTSPGTSSSE